MLTWNREAIALKVSPDCTVYVLACAVLKDGDAYRVCDWSLDDDNCVFTRNTGPTDDGTTENKLIAAGTDNKPTAKPAVTFFDNNRFNEWAPFLQILPSRLVGWFGLKEPYARQIDLRFTLGNPSSPPYVMTIHYDSAHGVLEII